MNAAIFTVKKSLFFYFQWIDICLFYLCSHKSLFNKKNKHGLPIGNLTSQFFANVYLDPIDQYVKHKLKCRHYVRYCDDMILLSNSTNQLECWRQNIEEYATKRLKLQLNKKATHIAPVNNGIDFLGFITRKDYILVRRRSKSGFKSFKMTNDSIHHAYL